MTKRPHVLIVEDDQWLAEHFARTLENAGYSTKIAAFGALAMDMIDQRVPDVLLVDVLLPGGTIFTLLHELRSHVDLASIPVIICTNGAEHLVQEDLAVYGVAGILDKAIMKPDDIVAQVKRVLL